MIATFDSMAGVVRSIKTNDKKMNNIHLRMGQSTVLRFKDDRPKKIVVGNQNYYNIEFVEGTKDVTLQPLGTVKTNLFVYCQKNTYGFLLATSNYGKYDDLVNVFWKEPKRRYKLKAKVLTVRKGKTRKLSSFLKVSKDLIASDFKVKSFKGKRTIYIDFSVKNTGMKEVNLRSLDGFLTRSNRKLLSQAFVIEKEKIRANEVIRARIVTTLKQRKGFSLNLILGDNKGKFIINRNKLP